MARPDPFIGKVIDDRYRLVQKIGAGGFGAVYRAEHLRLGSPFAIKFMFPMLAQDEALVARFEREAKTTSLLHHPHIVDVVDFGEEPALGLYLVMEFLAGETLRQRVRRDGAQDAATVLRIVDPICQALVTAHQRGVIHRDLKPANIFLVRTDVRDDFVKILDFGIAGLADDGGKGLTKTGMIMGSPPYMSPEQAWARKLDHRTDIYSLGVILYEMATGTTPFRGDSDIAVLDMQRSAAPLPPRRFRPDLDIPVGLEKVILRCLAKAPEERFQSIQAVRRELATLGTDLGVSGMTEIPDWGPDEPSDMGATAVFSTAVAAPPAAQDPLQLAQDPPPAARDPHPAPVALTAIDATGASVSQTGVEPSRVTPGRRRGALYAAVAGVAVVVTALVLVLTRPPAPEGATPAPPPGPATPSAAAGSATPGNAVEPAASLVAAVEAPDVSAPARVVAGDTASESDAPGSASGDDVPVPPAPEPSAPASAHLVLRTEPSGAEVLRGDESLCETPCDVRIDATGEAETLRIVLDGFEEETCEVTLVAGADIDREIRLDRLRRKRPPRRVRKEPEEPKSPGALPGIRLDGPAKKKTTAPPAGLPGLRVD